MECACEPQDQQHNYNKSEDSPQSASAVAAMCVVAAAPAQEQYQDDDDKYGSHGFHFLCRCASRILENQHHDSDTAMRALERALELNSNSAFANNFAATVTMFRERFDRAVQCAHRAIQLSPFDPLNDHAHLHFHRSASSGGMQGGHPLVRNGASLECGFRHPTRNLDRQPDECRPFVERSRLG
ncbi:hypothetical protein SAMN05216228_101695 [Rhizobium tibeticum]|uniref:Uncharacterized protein n=1 Tax=Rhizobium tibeticum TaxID=501024 RepID=A0A1H8PAG5_9HYPH|nr:hypothetical protein RTCCBAU85039_3802 [Rhizobium tibeticum]SEO38940.1 hypothetical protein SAMN05216228_101695 [Rhizobium tibeticum]